MTTATLRSQSNMAGTGKRIKHATINKVASNLPAPWATSKTSNMVTHQDICHFQGWIPFCRICKK
eukprot:6010391-Ditylum_brightwellii.AAC.1